MNPDAKSVDEALAYRNFEKLRFRVFSEDSNGMVYLYPDGKHAKSISWTLRVPKGDYESWGSPDSITGAQIAEYRSRLPV